MLTMRAQCAWVLVAVCWSFVAPTRAQTVAITGATIIDGTGKAPLSDGAVLIEDGRIGAIGRSRDVKIPKSVQKLDARGKYVIPGLMDANVHLGLSHNVNLEVLFKYEDRFDEIVAESAQRALQGGLTTVFDTWGPREALVKARDRINKGEIPGARIYLAGAIIGFDGPLSEGFIPDAAVKTLGKPSIERINARYEQGVGRKLRSMSPEGLREALREYFTKDVDFIKYWSNSGDFIIFSPRMQKVIVDESHRAGLTVQAHITSIEGLYLALDAGLDIVTHGDVSTPAVPIPEEALRRIVESGVAVSVLPATQRRLDALEKYTPDATTWKVAKTNRRNMIKSGVKLLLSTDAYLNNPDLLPEPVPLAADIVDPDRKIGEAHLNALVALEEEGMDRMEILKAATSNIAKAYKVDATLGTLEPGKAADMVILDANPLESARNYRRIGRVIKGGKVVDREALPVAPLITVKGGAD